MLTVILICSFLSCIKRAIYICTIIENRTRELSSYAITLPLTQSSNACYPKSIYELAFIFYIKNLLYFRIKTLNAGSKLVINKYDVIKTTNITAYISILYSCCLADVEIIKCSDILCFCVTLKVKEINIVRRLRHYMTSVLNVLHMTVTVRLEWV